MLTWATFWVYRDKNLNLDVVALFQALEGVRAGCLLWIQSNSKSLHLATFVSLDARMSACEDSCEAWAGQCDRLAFKFGYPGLIRVDLSREWQYLGQFLYV